MKPIVTLIGILLIVAVVVAQRPGGPEFGIFNVPLDHFRPQDTRVINFVGSKQHICITIKNKSLFRRHTILILIITMGVDRFSSMSVMVM